MAYTTIDKPTDYFNTKLYTGTGSAQSITGVGFSPEMSWFKQRNTTRGHVLEDIVRGAGKTLFPHDTSAETAGGYYLTSFDSDGFTLPSSNVGTNESSGTYVAWNWKAGGSASSNTDGSITSTVSANTTAGFSIVSYTGTASAGATVGHGLGVKPDMIITKARAIADNWGVYHKSLGATKALYLNSTNAENTSSAFYNNTEPTSTLVTFGDNEATNDNDTMIMYAFAEKKGYSKFGSYTGNGNADGTFVYTGFKPAWVMIKKSSGTNEWGVWDNKRSTFNVTDDIIYANLSNAEAANNANGLDFVSNGFKIRASGDLFNASSGSYIYMALAESPFVTSTGIPTTAR